MRPMQRLTALVKPGGCITVSDLISESIGFRKNGPILIPESCGLETFTALDLVRKLAVRLLARCQQKNSSMCCSTTRWFLRTVRIHIVHSFDALNCLLSGLLESRIVALHGTFSDLERRYQPLDEVSVKPENDT
jgi:hypothetical protein